MTELVALYTILKDLIRRVQSKFEYQQKEQVVRMDDKTLNEYIIKWKSEGYELCWINQENIFDLESNGFSKMKVKDKQKRIEYTFRTRDNLFLLGRMLE